MGERGLPRPGRPTDPTRRPTGRIEASWCRLVETSHTSGPTRGPMEDWSWRLGAELASEGSSPPEGGTHTCSRAAPGWRASRARVSWPVWPVATPTPDWMMSGISDPWRPRVSKLARPPNCRRRWVMVVAWAPKVQVMLHWDSFAVSAEPRYIHRWRWPKVRTTGTPVLSRVVWWCIGV